MKNRVRNNNKLVEKYMKEPKIEVMGSTMYKPYLGSRYTFTFNGFPVSIEFNGKPQKFPKTIAEVLQRKLNEVAEANAPKNVDTQLYI